MNKPESNKDPIDRKYLEQDKLIMAQTHTSYAVSKALKEFLGSSAPEPMGNTWYSPSGMLYTTIAPRPDSELPAYRLEDLLSKPFGEAFVKMGAKKFGFDEDEQTDYIADWSTDMAYAYWNGGLPAVGAELMRMMGKEEK